MTDKLEQELRDRLPTRLLERVPQPIDSPLSKMRCYRIDDNQSIFVKTNQTKDASIMFQGEIESLKEILATQTVRVPRPYFVVEDFDDKGTSAIVIEYLDIESINQETAKQLGEDLAKLHTYNSKLIRISRKSSSWIGRKAPSMNKTIAESSADDADIDDEDENQFAKHRMYIKSDDASFTKQDRTNPTVYPDRFVPEPNTEAVTEFGFKVPTTCGLIPQINEWTSDWISFYSRHRLDHQIRLILSDHGDRELNEQWSYLQLKVDKFFTDFDKDSDEKIIPALLHGDMWSGNVAQVKDQVDSRPCPVIYDPSSFYGHSEYDFGIARMFGGIPSSLEKSYFEVMTRKKLFDKRNKLYQLFHHLNHWNHFGYGYRSSSLRLIGELNKIV